MPAKEEPDPVEPVTSPTSKTLKFAGPYAVTMLIPDGRFVEINAGDPLPAGIDPWTVNAEDWK